ncbi:MAG: metallophosphoesterase [Hungatella sp.]
MWIWMVTAALLLLLLLLRSCDERNYFSTEIYEVESDKLEPEGKTVVFLSDLHDHTFGKEQSRLLEAIRKLQPEAILIGGDMMVVKQGVDLDATLFLVERLTKICPVYYGNGNHENRMDRDRGCYGDRYDQLRNRLSQMGVMHLSDQSCAFGDDIVISGLNLELPYYRKFSPEVMSPLYLQQRLGTADSGKFQILLAHSPLYFDAYAAWGADLTLAGHFHGGTIRLPWLGGLMTPQFQFFVPYCGGIFQKGKKYLVVSRGLGTHSINIRLNNRAHLVVVNLRLG